MDNFDMKLFKNDIESIKYPSFNDVHWYRHLHFKKLISLNIEDKVCDMFYSHHLLIPYIAYCY